MSKHCQIAIEYEYGNSVWPDSVTFKDDSFTQVVKYVPDIVEPAAPTWKFKAGDLVRVKNSYNGPNEWHGAKGVVKDVSAEGTRVEFGRIVEKNGCFTSRLFQHKTDALEPACDEPEVVEPKFAPGTIVEVTRSFGSRGEKGAHGVVVALEGNFVRVEFGVVVCSASKPTRWRFIHPNESLKEVTHD